MIKFDFKVTNNDKQELIKDIVHFTTYFLVIHVLSYTIDNEGSLFEEKTLKILLYGIIGMVVFNLITKKVFLKKSKKG